MLQKFCTDDLMIPKYQIGQKVRIIPAREQDLSSRNSELEQYAGQSAEIIDYYWISVDRGTKVFYIYTVRIDNNQKELVLHEDELEGYIA